MNIKHRMFFPFYACKKKQQFEAHENILDRNEVAGAQASAKEKVQTQTRARVQRRNIRQ